MRSELSVVTKAYDLTLWLVQRAGSFPREHRFTLGGRIEDGCLEVLELLVEASYTRDKAELLRRANLRLDRLRFLIRMAKDLKLISIKQYGFASGAIQAVGWEWSLPAEREALRNGQGTHFPMAEK
jgi:hypothetical protein